MTPATVSFTLFVALVVFGAGGLFAISLPPGSCTAIASMACAFRRPACWAPFGLGREGRW